MKSLYLDFEYRYPSNKNLGILCCAYDLEGEKRVVWLEDKEERERFAHFMYGACQIYPVVSYSIEAEARCLFQLFEEFELPYMCRLSKGIFRFVDLMLEYRMLQNHNNEISYGKQLINGVVKTTQAPKNKWEKVHSKDKEAASHKPEFNLGAACFKMLGVKIDTEEKTNVRNLIISNKALTLDDRTNIQSYCLSDIKFLPELHHKISAYLFKKVGARISSLNTLRKEVYRRGEYAARTAIMSRLGYPYAHKPLVKFSSQVKQILHEEIESINKRFPDVNAFQWNKKALDYVKKETPIRDWIQANCDLNKWPLTDSGRLSLSTDAFIENFTREDKGFGGAMRNYLKLKQDLNGFLPPKPNQKRKTFWESAGDDSRARPYYGIYGSQSARSQPFASGFIPLKANWMRAFIVPPEGKAIVGIDYASQEFLVAALISEDEVMIDAYLSGDPYTYFAKIDGAIPPDGDKSTHPEERDVYKTAVLGIGYLMGASSLAGRLSKALEKNYTEEDGRDLINAYNRAFEVFHDWQNDLIEDYYAAGKGAKIKLPCGWYMFGDNKNPKSVGNYPIQGLGSSIMRKAVAYAQDEGLDVIFTLHDAIYVEYPSQCIDYTVETLRNCMDKAFRFYFPKHMQKFANIRMDVFAWSPDYKNYNHPIYPTNHFYLDKKGKDGYNKFRKFLTFTEA